MIFNLSKPEAKAIIELDINVPFLEVSSTSNLQSQTSIISVSLKSCLEREHDDFILTWLSDSYETDKVVEKCSPKVRFSLFLVNDLTSHSGSFCKGRDEFFKTISNISSPDGFSAEVTVIDEQPTRNIIKRKLGFI